MFHIFHTIWALFNFYSQQCSLAPILHYIGHPYAKSHFSNISYSFPTLFPNFYT